MTKTAIVTALRFILSLATAGPAQAWPGQPDGAGISPPSTVDHAWSDYAVPVTLTRKLAPAHPHARKTEQAIMPLPPTTRLPDRAEDPLASMHSE